MRKKLRFLISDFKYGFNYSSLTNEQKEVIDSLVNNIEDIINDLLAHYYEFGYQDAEGDR